MAYVFVNIKARMGNQLFQFWAAKWVATQLNRELRVYFNEPIQINKDIYTNLGDYKLSPGIRVPYRNEELGYYTFSNSDVYEASSFNLNSIIEYHKTRTVPVLLDFYVEDYSIIRGNDDWVRNLYKRSPEYLLMCNDSIVIHLRLGDCANENSNVHNEYIHFSKMIVAKYKLPVIIVSEEVDHYCTRSLYDALVTNENNNLITIANNTIEEYEKDFDIISCAKVVVATNSTMSWWAAFLNPFNPDVYVALSDKQPQTQRNTTLFKRDCPDTWNIWNMDSNTWIKLFKENVCNDSITNTDSHMNTNTNTNIDIHTYYNNAVNKPSDINEHVETLYKYALKSQSIIELGVSEGNSSWGLLKGLYDNNYINKVLIQCDIRTYCPHTEIISEFTSKNNIKHEYLCMSDLDINVENASYDLTFIDTWHVYGQLKRELEKFAPITKKYIIMHDTEIDGYVGESVRVHQNIEEYATNLGWSIHDVSGGLLQAVNEFLQGNDEWKMIYQVKNNNGLTIFERIK